MGALAVVWQRRPQLTATCALAGNEDAQLDAEAGKLLWCGFPRLCTQLWLVGQRVATMDVA